jgi:AraC family transcriptional regulator
VELAQQINDIIDYVEDHLLEKIDYNKMSAIAGCSIYNLQRLFSYITNVSIADYVRYRRMTLAAIEVQESEIKIVDLALKYGYESPESFTRAFQAYHNVSPTSMRKSGINYNAYPRISYQMMIRGGIPDLGHETKIPGIVTQVIFKEAYSVLGIENKKSALIKDPKISACWDEFFQVKASELIEPFRKEPGFLGVFCSSEPEYWNYLIGAVVENCKQPPKGMFLREFPPSEYVIISHEPVATHGEAMAQIGRLVGYAHGGGWQCPVGYERYYDPIIFIESYPPEYDKKHRVEIWITIKKNNSINNETNDN